MERLSGLDAVARGRLWQAMIVLCYGWIFVGGVGTILTTMLLCRAYHPEEFDGSLPTISNAASMPPEDMVFTTGMCSVGICIAISWLTTCAFHRRISRRPEAPWRLWCGWATLAFGLGQGVAVAGLGLFTMETALELHMAASYATFICGAMALLSDSLMTAPRAESAGCVPHALGLARRVLARIVAVLSILFLLFFLTKDSDPFGDHLTTRWIYVGTEFVLATFSFAYALLPGLEILWCGRRRRRSTGSTDCPSPCASDPQGIGS